MERRTRRLELEDVRLTLKLQLIEEHYETLGEKLRWDRRRYNRLCGAMSLTVHEVGAVIRARPVEVDRWISRNQFPATASLLLSMIESAVLRTSDKPLIFPCTTSTS